MNLGTLFKLVITTSIYASIVAIVIMTIRMFVGHKLSAKWNYLLWVVLLFKLIVPFGPKSGISLFNVVKPPVIIQQATTDISNNSRTYSLQQSHGSNEVPTLSRSIPKPKDAVPFVWLFGCVLMLIWFEIANILLSRKLNNRLPANERILNIFNHCKDKMSIKKDIELIMQGYIQSPSLFGMVKPKILVSKSIESLSDKEIEYILLHELSHYKHRDIFINYTLLVFQSIHWFNPIIWYCFKKIRRDMELAADEKSLSYLDNAEYKDYGKALLAVVENFSSSKMTLNLLGMADESKNITRRVKRILKFKKPKIIGSIIATVIIAMVGVVCLTGAQNFSVENPDTDNKQNDKTYVESSESGIEVKIKGEDKENNSLNIEEGSVIAVTETENEETQPPEETPSSTTIPTTSQAPVATPPTQAIRPESENAGIVSANSYRVLPGTKVEHMKEYLAAEGKAQSEGTLIPLKNSYGYITKSDTRTVTTDDSGTVNLYGKSDLTDYISVIVVDKSTGRAVSNIGFSLSQNNYYSITGLEKNNDYDVNITVAEGSKENYILIY